MGEQHGYIALHSTICWFNIYLWPQWEQGVVTRGGVTNRSWSRIAGTQVFYSRWKSFTPVNLNPRSSSGQGREAGKRASSQRFETISSDPACIYYLSIFMCKQTASSIQCWIRHAWVLIRLQKTSCVRFNGITKLMASGKWAHSS